MHLFSLNWRRVALQYCVGFCHTAAWVSPAANSWVNELAHRAARPWVGCHVLLQSMKVKSESEVAQSCQLLATPWTAAHQAELSRQEYWSGVPLPSPELAIDIHLSPSSFTPTSHPTHPSRLSQSTGFELSVSYGKFPLAIYFTYANVYVWMLLYYGQSERRRRWDKLKDYASFLSMIFFSCMVFKN